MTTSHPKIGIRPIIDGRRGGIRESLEAMTMGMAQRVARLYSEELRYSDGSPVECVIADTTIGGVAEAAACTDKFRDSNVGAVLSVTPCWCYGAETIDMDPLIPKAIWGFNGTERPGAVYLASALAGHNQKGLPAFGIYGRDVQDMGDDTIPADVREKLLRFGRAAVAVMQMRGKSYLSIGSVSMGIAGSMPDPDFFQEYLGMRNEAVDCSEIERRIELGIYDKEEFARAMEWVEKYCKPNEGSDCNPAHLVYSREQKDAVWEYVVKMTLIFRDLMHGNPKLAEMGFEEEAMGHNAIAGGFQGQRQWTDFRPDGDFPEAILNSSFDWNGIREAVTFATENDTLNGASMLLLHLLTNRAQLFADVRTFWSPEAVERVTGRRLTGRAAGGIIHLINSGSCTLDATGQQSDAAGNPAMKPFWEISDKEAEACLQATTWYPAGREYMRGGGFSSHFLTRGEMPMTMCRLNLVNEQLGSQPRRHQFRTRRRRPRHAGRDAPHSGSHAQPRRRPALPPLGMGRLRLRPGRFRLSRLRDLRTDLQITTDTPKNRNHDHQKTSNAHCLHGTPRLFGRPGANAAGSPDDRIRQPAFGAYGDHSGGRRHG